MATQKMDIPQMFLGVFLLGAFAIAGCVVLVSRSRQRSIGLDAGIRCAGLRSGLDPVLSRERGGTDADPVLKQPMRFLSPWAGT